MLHVLLLFAGSSYTNYVVACIGTALLMLIVAFFIIGTVYIYRRTVGRARG